MITLIICVTTIVYIMCLPLNSQIIRPNVQLNLITTSNGRMLCQLAYVYRVLEQGIVYSLVVCYRTCPGKLSLLAFYNFSYADDDNHF